jgi:hypothetical protein
MWLNKRSWVRQEDAAHILASSQCVGWAQMVTAAPSPPPPPPTHPHTRCAHLIYFRYADSPLPPLAMSLAPAPVRPYLTWPALPVPACISSGPA